MLVIAAFVAMASGVVLALGDILSLPIGISLVAAATFIGSIALFGVITYRDARSSSSTFGVALVRGLRATGKVLVALMP